VFAEKGSAIIPAATSGLSNGVNEFQQLKCQYAEIVRLGNVNQIYFI
jgi:hypothetical protein